MTFLLLILPTSKESGHAEKAGKGHKKKSWLNHIKEIFHTIWSQPCSTMKIGRADWGGCFSETGHWLAFGEQLHCASLILFPPFFFFFIFVCFSLFFHLYSFPLFLSYWTVLISAHEYFSFLPNPTGRVGIEQMVVLCLAAYWIKPQKGKGMEAVELFCKQNRKTWNGEPRMMKKYATLFSSILNKKNRLIAGS